MITILNSVGCVIDGQTFMVYPQYANGGYDVDNGVYLGEVTNEWYMALNESDCRVVDTLLDIINN